MSQSQIKRFGHRRRACGIRKPSTSTRPVEHRTMPAFWGRTDSKRGTVKPTTLLCDGCDPRA